MGRKPKSDKKKSTSYSVSEATKIRLDKLKDELALPSATAVIEFLAAEKARKLKIDIEP
jgi:hypothetical protein